MRDRYWKIPQGGFGLDYGTTGGKTAGNRLDSIIAM